MQERGYAVDHSTIQRWVVHYAPRIEKVFRKNKKQTGFRWRIEESCLRTKGQWKYLYRAVDKEGDTIDFLLTVKRDKNAALRFLHVDRNCDRALRICPLISSLKRRWNVCLINK